MKTYLLLAFSLVASSLKSRAALQAENLALRHQLGVLQRSVKRAKIRPAVRVFWSILSRIWGDWKGALIFVKPDTVIRWQKKRFKEHWARLCQAGWPGRPEIPKEVRDLIRMMSKMNPTWGSPRIKGELAKIGIKVSKSTIEKYMIRAPKPSSPTWRSFLKNHSKDIVSVDFIVIPTVRFTMLYVFIFLSVDRRRVVHFNVTANPTAAWAAQQVVEAFPWDTQPKYLLRDREHIYGHRFQERVRGMGIEQVLIAPRSPWQNAYSERLNGSVRRECLDHMIVFSEAHLKRVLKGYFEYYNRYRVHQSLDMDTPEGREMQPPESGKVAPISHVGGLHYTLERKAA
jgi:transposase InsO family protein